MRRFDHKARNSKALHLESALLNSVQSQRLRPLHKPTPLALVRRKEFVKESTSLWVAVEDLNLHYHSPETIFFTVCIYIYIYIDNLILW